MQISRVKKHMTYDTVQTIFCTRSVYKEEDQVRYRTYMETEGGSLIPHYVCLNSFTYTDITETVIYVGAMHALDKHGKVKRHLDSYHRCMTGY